VVGPVLADPRAGGMMESMNDALAGPVVDIPPTITSGCTQLDQAWARYVPIIIDRPGVAIPDTENDLNWHAFLGHSIDMQGFRAAEFAGADALTRKAPGFVTLKDHGLGVQELASLWDIPAVQDHLLGLKGLPLSATLDVLKGAGGTAGVSLAEAFDCFPYRKGHWTVRALLQNSAALAPSGYSFRSWLRNECQQLGVPEFPPPDFRRPVSTPRGRVSLEAALRQRLEATFYQVGPALAPYMICDWQLWLWSRGRTAVFANFKWDAFHEQFVQRYGGVLLPATEPAFADWWLGLYPTLPPRLANECIWLATEKGTA
jgi:hypothetical protein